MTKRQKRGCALVVAGLMRLASGLGLHIIEQKRDELAGQNAKILLEQLGLNKLSVPIHTEGELLPSSYPLTLFTCTAGGQNRIVVRCEEIIRK